MKIITFLILITFSLTCFAAPESFTTGTSTASASSLSLTTTNSNLDVRTGINLKTNGTTGSPKTYRIAVVSANGGLKNANAITKGASAASVTLPYTLSWANTTGSMTANTVTIDTTTLKTLATVTDSSNGGNFIGSIRFSKTGTSAANMYSGTYTDTITLSGETTSPTATTVASGTFTLTAVVADTITLTVTPTASASNLTLSSTQNLLSIGTVSITSNCQNGYTLSISSSNAGKLVNTLAAATPASNEYINYSLYYQGSQVTTTVAPVTVATYNSATMISSLTQIGSVAMSYTGITPALMRGGTYQDNLTFTLQSQ